MPCMLKMDTFTKNCILSLRLLIINLVFGSKIPTMLNPELIYT